MGNNVVISALLFSGTPKRLVELRKKRNIRPFISKEIIDELWHIRNFIYLRKRLTILFIKKFFLMRFG
ncbi:MAG: hypothetical protein BWK80_20075 [Desulfobacteraceae bacterium IS3]|nr:MAG: hypothetical protein BWK80_20075 [Desulfobacteraceae bacterium IS3]